MKRLLIVALLGSQLLAQSTSATKEQTQEDANASNPKNFFGEEFRGHFSVTGNMSFQQEYDDNVFPNSGIGQQSGNLSSISGRISLNAQRPHTRWQMFYSPSVRVSESGPDNQSSSHQAGMDLISQLSARTTANASGTVAVVGASSVPSQQFIFVNGVALPVFQPEFISPGTRAISPSGNLGVTHLLSARDSLNLSFNGSANLLEPDRGVTPTLQSLGDTYSLSSSIGYGHNLNPGTSIGVSVQHTYLGYSMNTPHVNSDSASFTFSRSFSPQWQFSASIGPSFIVRAGDFVTSYAATAALTRSAARYTYGVTYGDGVQSSTISSATTQRIVGASFSRTLARRWTTGASFAWSQSSSEFAQGEASSYSGSARLGYAVTEQLSFNAGYSRSSQLSNGAFAAFRGYDRNLYTFGFTYNFKELLRF